MPLFLVRIACEYCLVVEAATPAEAVKTAMSEDPTEWARGEGSAAWSEAEAEPLNAPEGHAA